MMRRFFNSTEMRLIPILLVAVLAFASGCASTPEPVEEPEDTSEFTDQDAAAVTPPPSSDMNDTTVSNRNITVPPIYFDLDESRIKSDYELILQNGATALRDSGVSVTIAGHTDERGSYEYNLALGERRAGAVRRYLLDLGVAESQITTVSYGEARPAVSGTGETAWQLNRRAEFTVR
jgi:peptidoglycan-associated lipoprotein